MRRSALLLLLCVQLVSCNSNASRNSNVPPAAIDLSPPLDAVPPNIARLDVWDAGASIAHVLYVSPKAADAIVANTTFDEGKALQAAGGVFMAELLREEWDPTARTYKKVGDYAFEQIAAWANVHSIVLIDDCAEPLPLVHHLRCRGDKARLEHIAVIAPLQSLSLELARLQSSDLQSIAELPALSVLRLGHNDLRDLSPLGQLPSLKTLDVSFNPIEGPSLEAFLKGTALESLGLGGVEVPSSVWRAANLDALRRLDVRQSQFSDADLLEVATRAKGLQSLDLSHTNITDAGLAAAAPFLTGLTHLELEGTELTSQGIVHLAKLTSLQSLDLRFIAVTDDMVRALVPLVSLRSLTLQTDQLSCEVMADALKTWQKLETLTWMSSELDCNAHISTLPVLRQLWLDGSGVHPVFSRDLGQSATLEVVSLQNTFFTDDQLEGLATLTSLQQLLTSGTKITTGGCAKLNGALGRTVCRVP